MKPILVAIVGSRLYGTNKDTSDYDIKGVMINEVDEYCGLKNKEQVEISNGKEGKDNFNGTLYELRRIFHLLLKGNPTVLEPFCVDSKYLLHTTSIGEEVSKYVRENIITKHFFQPYFSYHHSQIKEFSDSKRTGKRKELFDTYGFDGKFASNAYRLAKQCVMIMKTGKLIPTLDDKEKEIVTKMRNYEFSKEECLEYLNNNVIEMNEAFSQTNLPEKPNFEKTNAFVTHVIHKYLGYCYNENEYIFFNPYARNFKPFDINNYPL